jgi:hypothetical protein
MVASDRTFGMTGQVIVVVGSGMEVARRLSLGGVMGEIHHSELSSCGAIEELHSGRLKVRMGGN